MLQFASIPIHPEAGTIIALRDVLGKIPANNLQWHILYFTGVGVAPDGLTMPAFERAARASPGGYRLTWNELLRFAKNIDQVWDCLIVGARHDVSVEREAMESGVLPDCDYVIAADDSTDWKLGAKDSAVQDNFLPLGKQE
jgi:hypothetical protein